MQRVPISTNSKAMEKKEEQGIMTETSPPNTTTTTHQHPVTPTHTQEREYLIKALLERGRPQISQLKCGIHHDLFYFGTAIPTPGNPRRPTNMIIASNKEIYLDEPGNSEETKKEIRTQLKLNYRGTFDYEVLDSLFSTKGIQDFLNGKQPMTIKQLFDVIMKLNREYMYYPDDEAHEYVALDIISTYFLPCFEAKGRTFLEAEKGSGKTRQCTIYKLLGFNSVMSADISKASFYRIMENTCGTLIIDDFDSLSDEQKNDILQHYKTGYKNTSKTVRTGEGKVRMQETYRTYGHVVMNNTGGLDPISADRSIFLPLLKADGEITTKPINEQEIRWRAITDNLFICALHFWKEVKDTHSLLTSKLSGRNFEVSRAVLSLAEIIDKRLFDRLESWLASCFDDNNNFDPETDWSFLGLKVFFDKDEGYSIKLNDIAKGIAENEGLYDGHKDWNTRTRAISSFLGKVFKNLPGAFRKKKIHGSLYIELRSQDTFRNYIHAKGWHWVGLGGVVDGLNLLEEEQIND